MNDHTDSPAPPSETVEPGPHRVLVTGGESGIGRAAAVALAGPRRHVAITWTRDEDDANEAAQEIEAKGATAHVRFLDLSDPQTGTTVVDELAAAMGGLDTLVLAAGTQAPGSLLDLPFEDWRTVLSIDLDGAFCCLQAGARHMVSGGRGGRIVAITSVNEHGPRVGAAAYCTAKGGLGLLVKVAALELGGHGITVNAVAPGEIATPLTGMGDESVVDDQRRPGFPVARPGDAREVAGVVNFLCSAEGAYVTGASWLVDGGMLLMAQTGSSETTDDSWRSL